MGVCIMSAVISGLLIYGIKQNRHSMLLPWLVLGTFGVVFSYFNLLAALFDFVAGSHNFLSFLYQVFSTDTDFNIKEYIVVEYIYKF
ncbi:uncharacterized protein LOC133842676 isoform X2 [Drosophila sulfurigaster albostrigata]|uniref:uncharacterized protein LOC133842676 isoform X2 n=1 Tax=Drosophila sulfurigaster albostrigata TaxID=89887 RepID=UPI002D21CE33|nr:uncharacterized protein LOC133842676 isoform X2 [Drosophila sulfurigaster albostrigata]